MPSDCSSSCSLLSHYFRLIACVNKWNKIYTNNLIIWFSFLFLFFYQILSRVLSGPIIKHNLLVENEILVRTLFRFAKTLYFASSTPASLLKGVEGGG